METNVQENSGRAASAAAYREETHALLRTYSRTRDLRLRNELVKRHERLVRYLAARFAPRGVVSTEDLVQVGYVGLITAIDRFDPEAGVNFSSFAAPTILGVIKHYLRDHTWSVKAPRRLREVAMKLRRLKEHLEQQLGRAPTIAEVAQAAEVTEEQILQAMEMDSLYYAHSLDAASSDQDGDSFDMFIDNLGGESPEFAQIDEREALKRVLDTLEPRERAILYGRFYHDSSQTEIARQLGISQMHVSRLERRALSRLRALLS